MLRFLKLDDLILHAKADGDDNALLELYGEAAEQAAEVSINRAIFKDETERATALATIETRLADAQMLVDQATTDIARNIAKIRYQAVVDQCHREANGILIDSHLIAAMMAVATSSYMIRSTVVAGSGAAAVEVPNTAEAVYAMRRYMGEVSYG